MNGKYAAKTLLSGRIQDPKVVVVFYFIYLFFLLLLQSGGIKDFGGNSDFQDTWKGSKVDAFNLYFFDTS